MAWAVDTRARTAWASTDVSMATPPGRTATPPPIPTATTLYTYLAQTGAGPWAFRGWAGYIPPVTTTPGGVSVAPDPADGVTRVWSWWPSAATLQLVRVHQDGSRNPVRGGYPLTVSGSTRKNLCPNPSFESGLNGYLALDGNTTISQVSVGSPRHNRCPNPSAGVNVTGWSARTASGTAITSVSQGAGAGFAGTGYVTATAVANANGGILLPTGDQVAAGSVYTVSVYALGTSASRTYTLSVDWLDASQALLSTTTGSGVSVAASWTRLSASATAPANAVYARPWVTVTSMTTGQTASFDAALYEQAALGSYFDGDSYAASWDGVAGNSASTLPDLTYVTSGIYAMRMTSTTTTTGAQIPGSLTAGAIPYTISLGLRVTARPTAVTISTSWLNASGGSAGTVTATLTDAQVNAAITAGTREAVTVTAPAGAVSGSVTLTITGLPVGERAEVDAVVIEQGATAGAFFDGSTFGGSWTGTAALSTSLLAPVQQLLDGECPLDTPVSYEVYNPSVNGGRVISPLATLASNEASWLTHPSSPGAPVTVDLARVPAQDRDIPQGVFYVLGRSRPVVVSSARRADAGTITINAYSFAERDNLLGLLADGSPMLLRAPADYGRGTGDWLSLGKATIDSGSRRAWQDMFTITAPYFVVDAPAGPGYTVT